MSLSRLSGSFGQCMRLLGGESGSHGRVSTNFGPEVWLQPHIRCTRGLRLVGTETGKRKQDKWALGEVKSLSAIDF